MSSRDKSSSAERRFYARNSQASSDSLDRLGGAGSTEVVASDRYYHVLRHLASNRPSRCVELGVGSDRYLSTLSSSCDHLTLLDVVDRTDGFRADNTRFIEHNLNEDFPLSTAEVDAVIALMVVEHLFDPFHSIREMARVLRPGGWLYLNVPLVTSIPNRLRLLMGRLPLTSRRDWYEVREWDGGHLHYFSLPVLRRLLTDNGFLDLVVHPVGRFLVLKALRPELLCAEITIVARRG